MNINLSLAGLYFELSFYIRTSIYYFLIVEVQVKMTI